MQFYGVTGDFTFVGRVAWTEPSSLAGAKADFYTDQSGVLWASALFKGPAPGRIPPWYAAVERKNWLGDRTMIWKWVEGRDPWESEGESSSPESNETIKLARDVRRGGGVIPRGSSGKILERGLKVRIKMDQRFSCLNGWNNEIHWYEGDDLRDLERR